MSFAGLCIGGPWDGKRHAGCAARLSVMEVPGAKLIEQCPDGKTAEHEYLWSDGAWHYQQSWVQIA